MRTVLEGLIKEADVRHRRAEYRNITGIIFYDAGDSSYWLVFLCSLSQRLHVTVKSYLYILHVHPLIHLHYHGKIEQNAKELTNTIEYRDKRLQLIKYWM